MHEQGIVKKNWLPLLIVLCTVLVLVIGGVTLYYVESQFVAEAGESLALAAVDIAGKLDLLMAERYGDIQMMARSRTFQEHDSMAMTQYLEWMALAYPVYEWLGVTDATGRIIAATDPATVGDDYSGSAWFRAGQDRVVVHVGAEAALVSDTRSVAAVAFTAPIKGAGGGIAGGHHFASRASGAGGRF